jgi:hypothetical protein
VTIEILDDAEQDIENGIRFYESQKQGLGRYFLDTILADIDSCLSQLLKLQIRIHHIFKQNTV